MTIMTIYLLWQKFCTVFSLALELYLVSIFQTEYEGSTGQATKCVSNIDGEAEYRSWLSSALILRHGLHTTHTAPRLSIYQIQKYMSAVCAVFVRVCVCTNSISAESSKGDLQKLVKGWENEDAKKSIKKEEREGENMANNWKVRESRGERSLCENCCGGFLSHRATGAESGRSTGECWPRWSCNFLSVACVGFAPAERHPETQLLTLCEAQAS